MQLSIIDNLFNILKEPSALDPVVISITQIHSGTTYNIPGRAFINGTIRTHKKYQIVQRMQEICKGYSDAYDTNIELDYNYGYPATINYKNRFCC